MLKISYQLESRPVHAVHVDFNIFVIGTAVEDFQGKFIDDLFQVDKAFAVHSRCLLIYVLSLPFSFLIIASIASISFFRN